MTDLVTRHEAEEPSTEPVPTAIDDSDDGIAHDNGDGTAPYEWAPPEPEAKKRRWWLWIGVPAALVVVGLIISSLLLIAPGAAVAGVPVGGMTQGAAADAIATRLAQTTVELTGDGGDVTLTGAELGASVDARTLAETVFAAHPAWKVTDWFAEPTAATVTLDPDKAAAALRSAVGDLYVEPTNAVVGFDAASQNYTVTAAVPGQGLDLDAVQAKLQDAFDAGRTATSMDPAVVPIDAAGSTASAQKSADALNAMLGTVGVYVGAERTVPVDRAVAASWLTVATAKDGAITVTADPALIQPMIDTLPAAINRAPVNASVITDTEGGVLSTTTEGVDGREVGDITGAAKDFAAQLGTMNGSFEVPVDVAPFTTVSLARNIVVNLSDQRVYLYENGAVIGSSIMSSGLPGLDTPSGSFRVFSHVREQDMGALCRNPAAVDSYCTKDVPWVTYFAPDIAFHGASAFRSSLGFPQSHGCVNMWNDDAAFIYDWAPVGTEVTVSY